MGGGQFSAWLIGENSLVTECATVLLDEGHAVRGIVSPEPRVRRWATDRGLAAAEHGPDLAVVLGAERFDYLFSVVNMRMLSKETLALPDKLAINFHDALLPADAGVHAAAWAVANGAARHGVTWHVMTEGADAGDLLVQREFAVPADATSYLLNVECWRAGLDSFTELAEKLGAGTVRRVPQDLARRSYHGRADRPDNGFVIRWAQPAGRIRALVRAGDFGSHPNAFGVAKVLVGHDGSCVLAREAAEGAARAARAAAVPGTVIEVSEGGMTVAAGDGAVCLSRFASLDGTPLTVADVAARFGIRAGTVLPEPSAALGAGFLEAERAAVRAEASWVRRLDGMRPLRLPFVRELPGTASRWRSHSVAVPVVVPAWVRESADPGATLAAAVLAYLTEVTGESARDVGLRVPVAGPLADVVPLAMPAPDEDFTRYAGQVAARLAETVSRGTFLLDIPARYPALSGRALALPVVLDLTSDLTLDLTGEAAAEPPPATELMFRISGSGDCVLAADESVLPAATANSLAGGLSAFLDALPGAGPHGAPLVSPAEHRWQAVACNDTTAGYPRNMTVPELVATQARQRPDKTAVVADREQLSYAELDEGSGRLAAYLTGQGAGPGTRVGVYLDRSADLLVTLLAVLRTGAAYVPLDPVYPAARISYMLADAAVALVVTQDSLARNVAGSAPRVLVLEECREQVSACPMAPLAPGRNEADLAYVIYTSGSTGRPKGVQVGHGGLVNFLTSMAREPGLSPDDVLLAVTTVCFDIAALELFGPLITGGTVHIAPAGTAGDGPALRALADRVRPTVLQATPVTWKALLDAGWAGDTGLTVLCGGEALPRDLAAALHERSKAVWNLYGPTETTIWSTAWRVQPDEPVSIGTPVANTSCHVTDSRGRLIPVGFPGELYIGGAGVAAGYRGRPELTAERFTTIPAADGVVYRTGDLARRGPDGRLYCLGRADSQVKLHGHRIEPGEIEAALREHSAVTDAVVVVRDIAGYGPQLVGYVIGDGLVGDGLVGHGLADSELRAFLRRTLPGYMIPALFTYLDEFPQTPNGKVDRKALPAPVRPEPAPLATAPADPVSLSSGTGPELLAAVLACTAAILGQPAVGLDADARFVDLGVDSLAAAELTRRLGALTGTTLSLVLVFKHPTPRALAEFIGRQRDGAVTEPAEQAIDLSAEAVLDAALVPAPAHAPASVDEPEHLVLTGATGFVGAFLLDEILRRTNAVVHCVVRGSDPGATGKRLQRVLEDYRLWGSRAATRVRVHPGDLTRPLLGLAPAEFDELSRLATAVYHAGAHVNAVLPYQELADANVSGTREALRLAAAHRSSSFHHVSTIEVFGEAAADGAPLTEEAPTGPPDALRGGYAQTKWVAEQFVAQAAARGLPATIYRLPRILGHTRTGACQTRDLLWQVLKGCLQAGAVPADLSGNFDMAPVDYAAGAIVALSRTAPLTGAAYHVSSPYRTSVATMAGYLRGAGYPLAECSLAEWAGLIRDCPGNAAVPVLDIFSQEMTGAGWGGLVLGTAATRRALGDQAPPCPPVSASLFGTWLRFFTDSGYLPAPGAARAVGG